MGQEGSHHEQDYRIVDREGHEITASTFRNAEQAATWVEEEALDRDLSKWTLQVREAGEWVDRMSTER